MNPRSRHIPRPANHRSRRATVSRGSLIALAAALAALASAPGASGSHGTTETSRVTGERGSSFTTLRAGPGWRRVVRRELAVPQRGRSARRGSLLYFTGLDELHITDEESPARVEYLDVDGTPFTSAFKPQEALIPFQDNQVIRAINRFAGRSPVSARGGRRARMALALITADTADNQQRNEVSQAVRLLEGGQLDPNSGVESNGACPGAQPAAGEAARYTGVQDYDDYFPAGGYYDPDQPAGRYSTWPRWPGLMDRAQQPFAAAGLRVPSYVSLGNHDGLRQGNQATNAGFEQIATGCTKLFSDTLASLPPGPPPVFPPSARPFTVPPDPNRIAVNPPELRAIYARGRQRDAHGFDYIDSAEERASRGAASYYAFTPKPGLRVISINTVSEGGVAGPSAEGNLDDPQFRWLERELSRAEARKQRIVVFGHHPIENLRSDVPDETAGPCPSGANTPPGCDLDPRSSQPLRDGADLRSLLLAHRGVVSYVAGHTAELNLTPFRRSGGGGFWQVESGSPHSWPSNARLLELMDNHDGTLSLFGTAVDQAGPVDVPPSGANAATFSPATLAAVGRTIAFNDPQDDVRAKEGAAGDRNAELLLRDPYPHRHARAGQRRDPRFTG